MRPAPSNDILFKYMMNYDNHNAGRLSLAGFFMAKSHTLLEKSLPKNFQPKTILEVGAGTGHHFPHVLPTFERYVLTDNSDVMLGIAKKNLERFNTPGLVFDKQDASKLTYPDSHFDRLIATHVLEHLPDPVSVLAEWERVVKPGGVISIVLPCDPGILWRLGRHLGPRRTALKAGIEYDYLQASEHINHITRLVTYIRYHFDKPKELWYPARIPISDLNLFYICHLIK